MFSPRNGPIRPNRSQKSKNLKFELGEKLDHRFQVRFYGKSNGDSLDALKRCSDPELCHKGQMWGQKSPNLKLKLRKKLSQHFGVKSYGKSIGDSLEAVKRYLDP